MGQQQMGTKKWENISGAGICAFVKGAGWEKQAEQNNCTIKNRHTHKERGGNPSGAQFDLDKSIRAPGLVLGLAGTGKQPTRDSKKMGTVI